MTTQETIMKSLRSRGYHQFFKGQHVQIEVAQWYKAQRKHVVVNGEGKKSDLIVDQVWPVDVITATLGKNGRYCFNNRHEEADYYILVTLDKPRLPMWIMTPTLEDKYKKGFSFRDDMNSDNFEVKFLGYLR